MANTTPNQMPEHYHDRGKGLTEVNDADRFELFLLQDGEKKVAETADTRKLPNHIFHSRAKSDTDIHKGIPSSSIFVFNKEDHTLGNLLRARLLQSPHVKFAGYKIPHPLFR